VQGVSCAEVKAGTATRPRAALLIVRICSAGGLIDQVSELLSGTGADCTPNLSIGYYDGNTVTALWNYAQHFAMSDNFFGSNFGTTVMGHLNLISGQTHGASPATVSGKVANGSVIANIDATADDCSTGTTIQMTGKNVGDLLNAKSITWGLVLRRLDADRHQWRQRAMHQSV
jgi:phospholipase C